VFRQNLGNIRAKIFKLNKLGYKIKTDAAVFLRDPDMELEVHGKPACVLKWAVLLQVFGQSASCDIS
jgi:hypothetical protein